MLNRVLFILILFILSNRTAKAQSGYTVSAAVGLNRVFEAPEDAETGTNLMLEAGWESNKKNTLQFTPSFSINRNSYKYELWKHTHFAMRQFETRLTLSVSLKVAKNVYVQPGIFLNGLVYSFCEIGSYNGANQFNAYSSNSITPSYKPAKLSTGATFRIYKFLGEKEMVRAFFQVSQHASSVIENDLYFQYSNWYQELIFKKETRPTAVLIGLTVVLEN